MPSESKLSRENRQLEPNQETKIKMVRRNLIKGEKKLSDEPKELNTLVRKSLKSRSQW